MVFFSMRLQNKHETTQMLLTELNEKQIITELDKVLLGFLDKVIIKWLNTRNRLKVSK